MNLLVSVCSALLGLVAIGALGVRRGQRGRNWPSVTATIVEGNVIEIHGAAGEPASVTHYVAVVRYTYSFEAPSAYRDRPALQGKLESPVHATSAEAYAMLAAYPVGTQVEVRYDPARPSRSVLATKAPSPGGR